jgi:hypothetical protein
VRAFGLRHVLPAGVVEHHFQLAALGPAPVQHAVQQSGHRDRTVPDGVHVVAVVGAQARIPVAGHRQPQPGAPVQRATGQLLHLDRHVQPGQPV